jgi:hypothetical protein
MIASCKARNVFGLGTKKSRPSPKTASFHRQTSWTGFENIVGSFSVVVVADVVVHCKDSNNKHEQESSE